MQQTAHPAPAFLSAIEDHPDYEVLQRVHELKVRVLSRKLDAAAQAPRDLDASRWVAGLLTTIVHNAALLTP